MSSKYSAEWWERTAGSNREILAPHDLFSVIDDLIQATASTKSCGTTSETLQRSSTAFGGEVQRSVRS
jgi:hypothetical protein